MDKEIEDSAIQIQKVSDVSPHNKAIYEAGKALLVESIDVGREFSRFMITVNTGAIPIYLGIVAFQLPEGVSLGTQRGGIAILPPLVYLIAATVFALGYMPRIGEFSLDIIEEIETERNSVIMRRKRFITVGFVLFLVATITAILVVMYNIGMR